MVEPFGQRFLGVVDSYPALSRAEVKHAQEHVDVSVRNDSIILGMFVGTHADGIEYATAPLPEIALSPEYAYVLYIKLRNALFGSSEFSGFASVE